MRLILLWSAEVLPSDLIDHESQFRGATVLVSAEAGQLQDDGIFMLPTVIAVDGSARVQFVMSGFDRRVSAHFINEHL